MVGIAKGETVGCLVASDPKWNHRLWRVVVVVDPGRSAPVLSGSGTVVVGIVWLESPSLSRALVVVSGMRLGCGVCRSRLVVSSVGSMVFHV